MFANLNLTASFTLLDLEAHWKKEVLSFMVPLDLLPRNLRPSARNLSSWLSMPPAYSMILWNITFPLPWTESNFLLVWPKFVTSRSWVLAYLNKIPVTVKLSFQFKNWVSILGYIAFSFSESPSQPFGIFSLFFMLSSIFGPWIPQEMSVLPCNSWSCKGMKP